ncbi:hypothetical protein ACJIZ3_017323 [Penstemon smallii]|uniref:Lysosomal Pro-Xaa carboxypeptidase n=1 Tax=Penstemon smallii TaxID=265156 RepID=A0ABD3SVZ5_9LAMI
MISFKVVVIHLSQYLYLVLLLLLLLPLFLNSSVLSSFPSHKIPRLTPYSSIKKLNLRNHHDKVFSASASAAVSAKHLKTYFYEQTLDHFNYGPQSYATFKQRYVVNSQHWGGSNSNSPIFAFFGAEEPLDDDFDFIGFLSDNAPSFKALQVYIEHRYYGESIPYGSIDEAMKNETIRGHFNSAQAMADYAKVLLHVKEKFSAHNSPIIVIGGSYGGMLASWFRLKYPHIALGALASSAPILYFDNITTPHNGYYSIVSKVFKGTSENCYKTIQKSWSEIDKVASKTNGLAFLSRKFKTCSHLNNSFELQDYLDSIYTEAAQYNLQPNDSVKMVCDGIDGTKGNDVLGRIFRGVISYKGKYDCYDTNEYNYPSQTTVGWHWQTCSEMVMPIGVEKNGTMFPTSPFNLHHFTNQCMGLYGVPPRPHWITTYYGGHDIKLVLRRFGSNIIFSNGLKDPYSGGGVLKDISGSVLAVTTVNGSHCMDILYATKTDPEWLVMQRKEEIRIIKGWITKYHYDLKALKK